MTSNDAEAIAEDLISQQWKWDKTSIQNILNSLGWERRDAPHHRDTYLLSGVIEASVYNDGENAELIEVEVDAFSDVDSLDELQYEDKIDEFYEKFRATSVQLGKYLGPPDFSDGAAADGFPDDQDVVWLSLWNLPTARFMVQQKHEGREIPFRLCLVVAPPSS